MDQVPTISLLLLFVPLIGCAVVSEKEAALFTDGRYFLQASQQLDENWTLMKQGLPNVPTWQEYLVKNLPPKSRIGVDPTLITACKFLATFFFLPSRFGPK